MESFDAPCGPEELSGEGEIAAASDFESLSFVCDAPASEVLSCFVLAGTTSLFLEAATAVLSFADVIERLGMAGSIEKEKDVAAVPGGTELTVIGKYVSRDISTLFDPAAPASLLMLERIPFDAPGAMVA
ncbi:hypothetical protein GOB94_01470 [Granulicella sp. 5B5]|uniref:hypothetical protein n=1 Tax=Granulicella sp. 5B5 TaxID=1617967 RepID=UPI0015F378BC|nr:hypothetical protein [Granulicella sp. 5B5]QMV17522.1 hypothetical protein GOB94_01470 [Granulicella sp. 5B5]